MSPPKADRSGFKPSSEATAFQAVEYSQLSSARSTQKMSFISARSFCGVGRALPLGRTGFDDTTFEIGQVMRTKLQYLLA